MAADGQDDVNDVSEASSVLGALRAAAELPRAAPPKPKSRAWAVHYPSAVILNLLFS